MAKRDYYDVLGLGRNAGQGEIKAAYKKLAKRYHPDVNKEAGAAEKFKEVLEAYHVLSDPQGKANYDQFGHVGMGEGFAGFRGFEGFDFSKAFDFEDLFSGFGGAGPFGSAFRDIFGNVRGARRGPSRGADLRVDLAVEFEEAASGTEREIKVSRLEKCDVCNGSGSKKGSDKVKCDVCNGTGFESHTRRTPFGIFSTQMTCRKCKGEGEIIKDPCNVCKGKGFRKVERKMKVKVPVGVDSGNHLRLHDEGNYGLGGIGDLFVVILVKPHDIFKRDGADIFAEVPLSFSEAALGATIEVPTLKGKAKLKVPAGTQTDMIFKMKGLGIKELHGSGKGDEYIKVVVKTPERLSRKQREIFEKLVEEEGNVRDSIFSSLKKKFWG